MSRPVSRQSRLETLVFPGKTGGFAAEVVGFERPAKTRTFSRNMTKRDAISNARSFQAKRLEDFRSN